MDSDKEDGIGWSCPMCTFFNAYYRQRCGICSSGRRHTDQSATVQGFVREAKDFVENKTQNRDVTEIGGVAEKESPNGDVWLCTSCTFSNTTSSWRCEMCHKRRKQNDESVTFPGKD